MSEINEVKWPNYKDSYGLFAVNEEEGNPIENQSPGQQVVVISNNAAPQVTRAASVFIPT